MGKTLYDIEPGEYSNEHLVNLLKTMTKFRDNVAAENKVLIEAMKSRFTFEEIDEIRRAQRRLSK